MSEFAGEPIAEIIEDNTAEYFVYLGRINGHAARDSPDVKCVFSGSDYYRILRARFPASRADGLVGQIVSRLDARGAEAVWNVTPLAVPELPGILQRHGFLYLKDWKSMAIALTGPIPETAVPPGLEIRAVQSRDDLDSWARVMLAGFEFDDPASEAFGRFLLARGTADGVWHRHYLGLLDQKPVATAALFGGSEAAGIYWVTTLPDARGLGVATAMTVHLLREAAASGYRIATLNASEAGYPLYRRLGFAEDFTTAIYHRPPQHR
jgi:ribosomal protein S18 acetylase RimI-like enzyme